MLKVIATILTLTIVVVASAGAQEVGRQPGNIQVHGTGAAKPVTLLDVLKKQKLANYPTAPIGDAFEKYGYFSRTEWKTYTEENGKIYIDFIGRFKKKWFGFANYPNNLASRDLEVKFVVNMTGDYGIVMGTIIELKKDGTVEKKPIEKLNGVIEKIYANKEIIF